MKEPIIKIEHLSKSYTISHRLPYETLRDTAVELLKKPFRSFRKSTQTTKEEFWALRDISFTISKGEKIGIIGSNGAGKSTLLKILSQITPPTTGQVVLHGRVASLLEVGTGFNPELTGRENIFLNGAILGMRQSEIRKKFDEIVSFAEIEKFIDTPVKRYSSGMYVRLAFAVAAHLEPEILIVDEVLAVGDQRFQKKCLGKMEDVGKDGRTVIFVSHNMNAINQLCEKCVLLERGQLVEFGKSQHVISTYTSSAYEKKASSVVFNSTTIRDGNGQFRFDAISLNNTQGEQTNRFPLGSDLILKVGYHAVNPQADAGLRMSIHIVASDGFRVANAVDADSKFFSTNAMDCKELTVTFKDVRLYPDTYSIDIWMGPEDSSATFDSIQNVINFEIFNDGSLTTRELPRHAGIIFFTPEWKSEKTTK